MTSSTISLALRRLARIVAGSHKSCPVEVVEGDAAPRECGESYYWTWTPNPDGTRVRHPNATSWRTYYHASTMRVQVGADWLAKHA